MKKINVFILFGIFLCFIFSCSHGFLKDPRLYNAKTAEKAAMSVAPEPSLELTGGVDTFDKTDQWYNNRASNGDEDSVDKLDFPHTDFETMSLVGTYFNNSNVPVYAMKHENVWVSKDAAKAEFVHAKAPDTEGQGYGISNVHWYQYRGKNPVYAADGNYNKTLEFTEKGNPKLCRFYFYRFTGKTLSPSLDNFLFAVDSYSKLMFAFAKPTDTKSVFGNNVPTAWGPTDSAPFIGQVYQFYMYDPVGYVEKKGDGSYNVVLYQWFSNNLAKGEYQPTLGGLNADSQGVPLNDVAKKQPDKPGKSPFNNHTADFFEENMKLLGKAGVPFFRRESTPSGGNGLVLYKYVISEDGKTITRTAESWNELSTTGLDTIEYTISKKEERDGGSATKGIATFNGSTIDFEISDESRTIIFNNKEKASSNFLDPGPDFIERVKHDPAYKYGEDSYTFSENGKVLTMNGTKYYYCENRESDTDKSRAVYKKNDASFYGLELSGKDSTIEMTSWSGFYAIRWYTLGWTAYLDEKPGTSFTDNLKGKTFTLRETDDEGAYTLNLHTYKFQNNSGTFVTTDWHTGQETTKSITVSNGSSNETGTVDGQPATLSMPENGNWTLTINGKTYYRNYKDPGPSFIYRVRNRWYQGQHLWYPEHNYVFSADGKTMYYIYDGTTEAYSWNGNPTDTERTNYSGWISNFLVEDNDSQKAYELDYENANTNYDATYKGTAEAAKNAGLSFP